MGRKLTILKWSSEYETGIKRLDRQHKKLIEMTDLCVQALRRHISQKEINLLLKDLIIFSTDHIKLEEQLMDQIGYEASEEHKAEHLNFNDQVAVYIQQYIDQESLPLKSLCYFLENWLLSHILVSDRKLTEILKSRGIQ